MTGQQMVQLVCTTILMVTVVLAGIFGTDLTTKWLKNRREERRNAVREAEQRASDRFDRERTSWLAILAEKDKELENVNQMLTRLQKNYDIATKILTVAKKEEV